MINLAIFLLVVILLLMCVFFIQKKRIDSLKDNLETSLEDKDKLKQELKFVNEQKSKAEVEVLRKSQENKTLISSIEEVSKSNETLKSSLTNITEAYQQVSKNLEDMQVGILKIEFETTGKSKKAALNRMLLKAGSTIVDAGNVLFNIEGHKEKGIIYILNALNYEKAKNSKI